MLQVLSGIKVLLDWTNFKKYIDGTYKSLSLQFVDDSDKYEIFCIDQNIFYICYIYKSGASVINLNTTQNDTDRVDFETNYILSGNKPLGNYVKLQDFGDLDPKKRRSKTKGFSIQANAGVMTSSIDLSFNSDIELLHGETFANWSEFNYEDKVEISVVLPNDGLIGTTTISNSIGDTVIDVQESVVKNLVEGDLIEIGSELFEYYVKSVDEGNKQVTVSPALQVAKSNGDTVKLRVYKAGDISLLANAYNKIGKDNFGSSKLEEGQILRIKYKHKLAPSQNFLMPFNLVYNHGKKL